MPSGHGSYQGHELELLDPADADQLMLLLEARHAELGDAPRSGGEVIVDGEPFSPRLHLAMHQIVANQLLADDPPETWQTVQRLAGLGYDWHNIMHIIAWLLSDDLHSALAERREFDAADYARRLAKLPGDWPLPQAPTCPKADRGGLPSRANNRSGPITRACWRPVWIPGIDGSAVAALRSRAVTTSEPRLRRS